MKIAIVIVTYNACKWMDSCIHPLANIDENKRVYIIDNGSTDGTQEYIKSNFPQFYFHQSSTNLGFGKANNLGLKKALEDGADYFLLLNQDAHMSWENIATLAEIQQRNKEYGILTPIQMYNESSLDYMHYSHLQKSENNFFNDLIAKNKLKEVYEVVFANAAIWMLSKECLKVSGGFDPLYFHYGEDDEYVQKVQYFNLKVGVCPSVKGFHYRNQNVPRPLNEAYFYKKYLTLLMNNNKNLLVQYFIIFIKIVLSTFRKANKKYKTSSVGSLKAFVKLCFMVRKIIQNRRDTKEYRFIYN